MSRWLKCATALILATAAIACAERLHPLEDRFLMELRCGNKARAQELLQSADLSDFRQEYLYDAVYEQIVQGNADMIRMLLEEGLDPNGQVFLEEAGTPFVALAMKRSHSEIALALLEAGARIDYMDPSGGTLLHYAAASCSDDVVAKLIEKGLDVDALSSAEKWGGTPLHCAAREGNSSAIPVLLDAGAEMYAANHGNTALDLAIDSAEIECIRALLDAGFYVNHIDSDLRTPLLYACMHWQIEVDNLPMTNPGIAVDKAQEQLTTIAGLLIEAGAYVNMADRDEITPLHWAAAAGPVSRVILLIEAGADVNATDWNGGTPLSWANYPYPHPQDQYSTHPKVQEVLIAAGAHL